MPHPARKTTWPLLAALAAALLAFPARADAAATDLDFTGSGGVTLHATVVSPDTPGPHPAMVMLPGAGPVTRAELAEEAAAFARLGVVVLTYGKRPDYDLFHRDYTVLADDALAAHALLRAQPGVDPARTGVWGLSEGAWAAPIAAATSSDVAFVVVAGAVGVTPARQTAWAYRQYLRHQGVRGSLADMLPETALPFGAASGLFGEVGHDPLPTWRRVRQPVLAVWGELDREAVPAESAPAIAGALAEGGGTSCTIAFLPGVRHNLGATFDDGFDRPDALPAAYGELEAAWIHGLADGPPPSSAAPFTGATEPSRAVEEPGGLNTPWVQMAAYLLMLLVYLAYPVTALVQRARGRRGKPAVAARTTRLAVGLGTATLAGFLGYLGFLVVTAANLAGPVVLGQPVPWWILQGLALATVIATGAAAVLGLRGRETLRGTHRVRLWTVVAAGAVFVPWTAHWGLLLP
ncbi:alpha/beta hydrolase family protein [Phytomonospora endophytica]|uniref:Peptidase S9 prolyl oligopeptidase catalytic domain-containing protein n=1 Tax=Phytomonospora endophytica TaxID=714109 RepID=A0A841FVZ8_9ACTN|nr:prolyl oligopeptidase family serine peptidase [Phytomonospora endophytica]MBB6036659.1 hypothetical protein [Phytomonospora endophytica]GIG65981.1 hypothetical protein Pen01_22760 [Phytomonospora endophytica]